MILTTYIVFLVHVFVKKLSDFEKFYEFGVFKKKWYENMIPLNKDSLIKMSLKIFKKFEIKLSYKFWTKNGLNFNPY